jgi:hypothetical protein
MTLPYSALNLSIQTIESLLKKNEIWARKDVSKRETFTRKEEYSRVKKTHFAIDSNGNLKNGSRARIVSGRSLRIRFYDLVFPSRLTYDAPLFPEAGMRLKYVLFCSDSIVGAHFARFIVWQ